MAADGIDPTLGIRLARLSRASTHWPITINVATWSKPVYGNICRLGGFADEITREDLKTHAASTDLSDSDGVRRLFVEVMMWGSGKRNGRGPRYTEMALASVGAVETLLEARTRLEAGDIEGAYPLFGDLGGIGPSFFTKWLWLMGHNAGTSPRPLILDDRVGASLVALGWDSRKAAGSRRRSARYVAYLRACEIWASEHPGFTPEDVEFSLFRGDWIE